MTSVTRSLLHAVTAGLVLSALTIALLQHRQFLATPATPVSEPVPAPVAVPSGPASYHDAVSKASRSVVSIRTATPSSAAADRVSVGLASGVVLRSDGYVVTNDHVIRNVEAIVVSVPDGRNLTAKIVGRDPTTDLAVLKVDAQLPAITPAAEKVRVGDVVLAIGYPVTLGQTVTQGVVSATYSLDLGTVSIIQTDAANNQGNSGGALVNSNGDWVGINSAVFPTQLGIQGIGFAITTEQVLVVADEIIRKGRVIRGTLGFTGNVSALELRQQNLNPAPAPINAVRVESVTADGPAAKAGLQVGDWITHIDGQLIAGGADLRKRIADAEPGALMRVRVRRDNTVVELEALVAEQIPAH